MHRTTTAATAATAAVIAALALAAPAGASPTLTLDHPCFRSGQAGGATVTDFDPNTDVDVLLGGASIGAHQTDDQGAFSVSFSVPKLGAGVKRASSRLTAQDATGLIAEDVFDIVPLTLSMSPKRGSWSSRVAVSVNGFVERSTLYEHVLRGGKLIDDVVFGTPRAPCGSLRRTVKRLPLRRPKPGSYTVQLDDEPNYASTSRPAVRWTVKVPR